MFDLVSKRRSGIGDLLTRLLLDTRILIRGLEDQIHVTLQSQNSDSRTIWDPQRLPLRWCYRRRLTHSVPDRGLLRPTAMVIDPVFDTLALEKFRFFVDRLRWRLRCVRSHGTLTLPTIACTYSQITIIELCLP